MNEDTILNVTSTIERRILGIALATSGNMQLISNKASFADPFGNQGEYPGVHDILVQDLDP